MFEGDSTDKCAGKISASVDGGRAEGLECADPGARTPIGVSGNSLYFNNLLIKISFTFASF